jgi:hypothetical protein
MYLKSTVFLTHDAYGLPDLAGTLVLPLSQTNYATLQYTDKCSTEVFYRVSDSEASAVKSRETTCCEI